jgi:glyoxylase-like metal-dependent hydrolase (beta-lactamase superfamily II)
MKRRRWFPIFFLLSAASLSAAEQLFDLKPVVPGVWAAIAKPQFKVNCNAVVIELDDGLLVVDTHSKPSAAQALMVQVKSVSSKPVKFVVDTHFHWDHYQGNQAYLSAWPQGVEIISSDATRESIEHRGIPRLKSEMLQVPREIVQLKADLARATEASKKAEIEENLRQAESYLAELQAMKIALPTLTFDRSLIIHQRSRTVQILWLGKAHTDGDVFVYVPKEKFIATGDALQGWVPFMGDSYPYDWIKTLEAAERLDIDYAVGGHGDVLHGKERFHFSEQYLRDLMAETERAYAEGATMAETVKRVSAVIVPKYASGMPPTFPQDIVGNIQKAYRVVSGETD